MKQLGVLISTERPTGVKHLPTLNLLDITTAHSWSKMRRIVKDYGKRMTIRHELLLPVIFLYMIVVYLFIWLAHFKIIPINKELLDNLNPFIYIDFVLLTSMTLVLVYHTARVNWFYDSHIFKIEKIKKMIKEMYIFREHYFGIDRGNAFSLIRLQDELVFQNDLTDPVISAYVDHLVGICPKKDIPKYLEELY